MSTSASSSSASANSQTLQERLLVLCKDVQFVWFLGHVLLLTCGTRFFLSFITLGWNSHQLAYKAAIFGSLITYGIVLFKTYSNPKSHPNGVLNLQFASKIWADENTQYFVLASYWFLSKPIAIALVPFFCFSVFHFLTYLRTVILPAVDPSVNSPESKTQAARISKLSNDWIKGNYEKAMKIVASIEVLGLGARVFFGVLTFGYILPQTSFTTLLVLANFLRFRYFTSPFTRQQFTQLSLNIDHAVADARVPPAIRQGWAVVKKLVSNYAGPQASHTAPVGQRKAQ